MKLRLNIHYNNKICLPLAKTLQNNLYMFQTPLRSKYAQNKYNSYITAKLIQTYSNTLKQQQFKIFQTALLLWNNSQVIHSQVMLVHIYTSLISLMSYTSMSQCMINYPIRGVGCGQTTWYCTAIAWWAYEFCMPLCVFCVPLYCFNNKCDIHFTPE